MMKPRNIWIAPCILLLGLTACLKETTLPVKASFDYLIEGENQTTPVQLSITNTSTGANFYEWSFEGGKPEQSREKHPANIVFTQPGEHRITLRAWNDVKEEFSQRIVRVDSAVSIGFTYRIQVNDFAPARVEITNTTLGATAYAWTFEGGMPASSTLAAPGVVNYAEGGVYKIRLKVYNGSEYVSTEKEMVLKPRLLTDFAMEPIVADRDMEAPLTMKVKNLSRNYLSHRWLSEDGVVNDAEAEETTIRVQQPGIYTVSLLADNKKEQYTMSKQFTVKENSGIHRFRNIRLGINQAKNTVGCFFSADDQRVLLSKEMTDAEIGRRIDFGFFALNSAFDYCYFISPDKASQAAFPPIPGAIKTDIQNHPEKEYAWTERTFENIAKASDMDVFHFSVGNNGDYFSLNKLPVFALFRTADGRRGVICIKDAVKSGAGSYIVADIKMEKRPEE